MSLCVDPASAVVRFSCQLSQKGPGGLGVAALGRSLCLLEVVFVSSHSTATLWSKQQHV